MIKELILHSGSYSKKKIQQFEFDKSLVEVKRNVPNKYSNTGKSNLIFYNGKRITKSTIVKGICDICGKTIERTFRLREYFRHQDQLFCSRQCALKSKSTINKIIFTRFGNKGIIKHKNKIIKNNNFEQFINSNLKQSIELIKKYPDFLNSEKGLKIINELYVNKNKTRKETSKILNLNIEPFIRKYNIRKYSISENHKQKCSNSLIKIWNSGNRKKNINKGGRSNWISFIDKHEKTHKLQGSYELRFAKILNNSNLSWEAYHKSIKINNFRYAPDFIVENRYVDTKADYFYQINKDKIDFLKKEIGLILILTNDLNNIEQTPNLLLEKLNG